MFFQAYFSVTSTPYCIICYVFCKRIEYNIINEDFFRPGSPFPPSPPYLDTCTRETLHIAWNLPEATGIAQLCELQYSKYDNEKDKDKGKGGDHSHDVNSTPSVKWITCASKRWEYANFTNFLLENLSPGMYYIFRVKYRNNLNWSEYSTPSKPLRTLSDVPRSYTNFISPRLLLLLFFYFFSPCISILIKNI